MERAQNKIAYGIIWSATERFSTQLIQFVVTVIMARILLPSDFGLIGMLSIFFAISQSFIDSGFSKALIQKKSATDDDFSTIFYFNIVIGGLFFFVLFLLAPAIARFYGIPALCTLARVLAFNLVINSFSIIQRTKVAIDLDFKLLTKASWISVLAGGVIGIYMAYSGFGVWAIAIQSISANFVITACLWSFGKWKPKRVFSRKSFQQSFSFGSNLLVAGIIYNLFDNIYLMIIGKNYDARSLGYYDKARNFAQLPSLNIANIIQRATFPVLSQMQEDKVKLHASFNKLIKLTSFVVMPLMVSLAVIANPLIHMLLSEKWLPAVPFFQLMCFVLIWFPLDELNVNLINSTGDTALVLKLEIVKKIFAFSLLILTLPHGIIYIIIGQIFSSIIAMVLSMHYGGKKIEYKLSKQICDVLPFLGMSILANGIAYLLMIVVLIPLFQILVALTIVFTIYIGLALLLRMQELKDIILIVNKR